ncbi:MAG: hypothetical protein Q9182_004870 [Xanthomendoza sp. 2 TL-2023]
MADSPAIANTALVISIVALLVTTTQLLSQIFSTAEGHRRCQPSVIGPWAMLTKRKWRWSSFRFETLVATPEITFGKFSLTDIIEQIEGGIRWQAAFDSPPDEAACWIPFIVALLRASTSNAELNDVGNIDTPHPHLSFPVTPTAKMLTKPTLPVVYNRTRSWDFMPPDVVRPFASIRVFYLAIIALRMGMTWKRFEPEQGALEAEGNGHSLTSVLIRALGTVVRYTPSVMSNKGQFLVESYLQSPESLMAPEGSHVETSEADRMWFGILPGNTKILSKHYRNDFLIGDCDSVYAILDKMDPSRKASQALVKAAPSLLGFNDIIPMLAPWMRYKRTTVNIIPAVTYDTRSITSFSGPRAVFQSRLHTKAASNSSSISAESRYLVGCKPYTLPKLFAEGPLTSIDQRLTKIMTLRQQLANIQRDESIRRAKRIEFYDLLQDTYDLTTEYFKGDAYVYGAYPFYFDLVKTHLLRAVTVRERSKMDFHQDRGTTSEISDAEMSHVMSLYWDDVPYYQQEMQKKNYKNGDLVEEAWIVLIFRAILWSLAHDFDDHQKPLPARYYGSSSPVYIG